MSVPNVLFNVKYAQNEETIISKNLSSEYLSQRLFYACKQADDYIKYVDKGVAAGDVLGYTGNPEKSSGIFSQKGFLSKQQRSELRGKLRNTKSIIWHTIISFTEIFGEKYMKDGAEAHKLLCAELPRFFRRIGIKEDNAEWFAGLHENTDNQHIHLCFFEKEPVFCSARDKAKKRYRYGKISKDAIDSFVVGVEARLTDVAFDLKRSRSELMSASKGALWDLGLNNFESELRSKLLRLYKALPTEGRIGYNNICMAGLRPQIRGIVNFIIKNNGDVKARYKQFCADLIKRDSDVRDMCVRQNISNQTMHLVEDKYLEDMYRRLGDKVIQAAFAIKNKEEREKKKYKNYRAKKRVEQRHRKFLFEHSLKIAEDVDREAIRAFTEYRQKLAEAEYERLIEEGVMEAE